MKNDLAWLAIAAAWPLAALAQQPGPNQPPVPTTQGAPSTVPGVAGAPNAGSAAPSAASPPVERAGMATTTLSQHDQDFLAKAMEDSVAERKFGDFAHHSDRPDVTKFAMKLTNDHVTAAEQLGQIAAHTNARQSTELSDADMQTYNTLKDLHGPAFDKAFLEDVRTHHEAAIALLQGEVAEGQDKDLVAWAKKTLPKIEHHLAMAKKLEAGQTASTK